MRLCRAHGRLQRSPTPDFFDDATPLASLGKLGGVAIEIWTMDSGIYFDNIFIGDSAEEAEAAREALWAPKSAKEVR